MIIDDSHFKYLSISHGTVSDFRHDRALWQQKYEESIQSIFNSIEPYLPNAEWNVSMDIGSSLGGIDVLIYNHYKGKCNINLLDGANDEAEVIKHNQTFCNAMVADDFLRVNGVKQGDAGLWSPKHCSEARPDIDLRFSLFVSFASYCFHYSPKQYLEFIKSTAQEQCTLIFDVRKGKPDWLRMLTDNFTYVGTAAEGKKFERMVFKK